jgi:rod shape determining protein RodA
MNQPSQRYHRYSPNTGAEFSRSRDLWLILRTDSVLAILLLILCCVGLISLYSASGGDVGMTTKQGSSFIIGFAVLLVMARIPPATYHYISPWFFAGGVVLLIAVELFGQVRMGAQRWLSVPGIASIQPSEFMKIGMPMMIAWYLSSRAMGKITMKDLAVSFALLMVPVVLIVKQPDLGTSILVFVSGFFVIFLAGLSWRLITTAMVLVAAAAPLAWQFLHDYQRRRVMTLFNPDADPLGAGWNIIQSKTAIGSGGLFGKGWMNGTQSHLHFLPEGHTDFIIAAFSEEFGFIGVAALFMLYFAISARCLFITLSAQSSYARLLAGAITLSFFIYIFVNVGMVSGILPVVGVPLPFMSYGGTAIITLMAGFGILMSIHSNRKLMG